MRFNINNYIKDNKLLEPSICHKCGGKMIKKYDGLVFECDNPDCRAEIISDIAKKKENP